MSHWSLTSRRLTFVVLGLCTVLVAILVPAGTVAAALDPAASGERMESLQTGVRLFKLGAVVHGLLLVAVALLYTSSAATAPLWRPPAREIDALPARRRKTLVLAIFTTAVALRLPGLGGDLWVDEVQTLTDFVRPGLSRILTVFPSDNHHVLYSALGHVSIAVFGDGAVALRLPSVLLGLGSLWAVLRLGRFLLGDHQALLAAALLAFSYHHVWFSQNARGYTGLLLATVLATELFLRGLWLGRWRIWLLYAGVVAVGMWMHLMMIFVAASHAAVLLALFARARSVRDGRGRGLAALALAGLFTFQLYALIIPQMAAHFLQPGAGSRDLAKEVRSPEWLASEAIRGLAEGNMLGWIGLAGAGALLVVGILSLVRRDCVIVSLFLVPPLFVGLSLFLLDRNLWPRSFFNELGFAGLLVAHGAAAVGETAASRLRRRVVVAPNKVALVLTGLLVAASAASLPRLYRHPKQDFSGARDFVLGNCGPDDRIAAVGIAAEAYSRYYAPDWLFAQTPEELEAARSSAGTTWVVYTFPSLLRSGQPRLAQMIESQFEVVRSFPGTVGDGTLFVCRSAHPDVSSRGEP